VFTKFRKLSWEKQRLFTINPIYDYGLRNQHFVTAFMGIQLKHQDLGKFLSVQPNSNEKLWTGFVPRSSVGLELLHDVGVK
jgi:hypothetical protein